MKRESFSGSALALILALAPAAVHGEEVVTVGESLVIGSSDWYRSAGSIDPIETAMVRGDWSPPQAGDAVDFGAGKQHVWRRVVADEDGWMRDDALRGGYAYVSIDSREERVVILEGMAHRMVYVNGEPRVGNLYQYKEEWETWEPRFDYSQIPVRLKEGRNHLLFRGGRAARIKVLVHAPRAEIMINTNDVTAPDLFVGRKFDDWASVVVINATQAAVESGVRLVSRVGSGPEIVNDLPMLQPLSVRKVAFKLVGKAPAQPGRTSVSVRLFAGPTLLDEREIPLEVKHPHENHARTFISEIDGSVQYFSVNPAQDPERFPQPALFLSVHGAAVEAINQSGSYAAKSWGHVVSPTNRRPYGFNWEDWGRIDALEVFHIAMNTLNIDPGRVYLTGHSMGGHGTWHLGALYPDLFAALGPSAGWISFWSYRPSREVEADTPMTRMLMRATLPSRTFDLAPNYREHGIYIVHGADDDNVSAEQARQMVARLETVHRDFVYHEEPDAGHWWDKLDEDGSDCVDWQPMFDFFARHTRPGKERIRRVEFRTPNPGVSAWHHWLCVEAQQRQLEMSSVDIRFDPGKRRFVGTTDNVARLGFDVAHVEDDGPLTFAIDGETLTGVEYPTETRHVILHDENGSWRVGGEAPPEHKGHHRNGTFKDVFNRRVIFVYGTKGSDEENAWALNKARYDAETFWYQGNGSIDVIRDRDFQASEEIDRNVVLYGNANTNSAWRALLGDSPVQVRRGQVLLGKEKIEGGDLGVLVIRPRPGSDLASVGAVAGTGIVGMRLTDVRPYLYPGFAYPDVVVFCAHKLDQSPEAACAAGFFGLNWGMEGGEFVWELPKASAVRPPSRSRRVMKAGSVWIAIAAVQGVEATHGIGVMR